MNVIMISPAFPAEMPQFTRGLAEVGARVIGLGDSPKQALSPEVARCLAAYLRVPSLWDEEAVVEEVKRDVGSRSIDRVECLWEPGVILAARLREALGVPGMPVEEAILFRDKEKMKLALDAAGIRTPRHGQASTDDEIRAAAERIGFPVIVKPIAGAGSADTYRVGDAAELEDAISLVRHVPVVSVEEFIEGNEFTYDTICADGEVLFFNVGTYRPTALLSRLHEWLSPQTLALRQVDAPALEPGVRMGRDVLTALGFQTGFTHMEWFLTPNGEAVFGEIACRPPGARSVDTMNFASDIDLYLGWAEAVCHGRFSQPITRRYNSAVVFKRARGEGRIQRIEGLGELLFSIGDHIAAVELLPVGALRRNWKQTLLSDGWVVVRHPDYETTKELADRVGTDLQMYAE